MEYEKVKKLLEKEGKEDEPAEMDKYPFRLFDRFFMSGLRIHLIEPGRVLFSFKLPPRLLNTDNTLHSGAIASWMDLVGSAAILAAGSRAVGVPVEINVSYLDAALPNEEIEIEAKALHAGRKAIVVVAVEFREKATGKIIARGRMTSYILAATSKL